MTVDPQEIRSEPHRQIGALLQQQVDDVLERWTSRAIAEQPHANRVHHQVLLDHLRDFLQKLGESLAQPAIAETVQIRQSAVIHGEQRWESGWSLSEVVRDYQILRIVIVDFLEESLGRLLHYREVLAIGLALDEAITVSVTTYVKHRDNRVEQLAARREEEDRLIQQRLREQAEALQEADRRKNEFLAILAHELRNPLAPIRNAAQILRMLDGDNEVVQSVSEIMERQVGQMARLVDDLLEVSRISRGKIYLRHEQVAVSSVIYNAVEAAQAQINSMNHNLAVRLPPESLYLSADPIRLAQVITNLLSNACKFTPPKGQISLTAKKEGEQVVIRVKDNGIGIATSQLHRIFDMFVQADNSLERSDGGLGIGLTLVKELVDMHGGTVEAHSAGLGQGSELVVRLPISTTESDLNVPAAAATDDVTPVVSRRVLVVDDNRDSAKTLSLMLTASGHETRTAHDGVEAVEAAEEFKPEVILLDIGLPKLNGYEACRRIRKQPWGQGMTLIALTGWGQEADRQRSVEAGFDSHVLKPIDYVSLTKLLAK